MVVLLGHIWAAQGDFILCECFNADWCEMKSPCAAQMWLSSTTINI